MIDEQTTTMILEALNDEYKARAFYRLVITMFGPVRPFINIVRAEETHAQALDVLCAKYEIPLPADEWGRTLQPPASVLEACQAGVEGEIENMALDDRFLKETDSPDIRALFQRLQARSREAHLPAFRRCMARGGEAGRGQGQGEASPRRTGAGSGPTRRRGRGA